MMAATPSHNDDDSPISNALSDTSELDEDNKSPPAAVPTATAIHARVHRTDLEPTLRAGVMPTSVPARRSSRASSRGYRGDSPHSSRDHDDDNSPGDVELPLLNQPRVLSTMDEDDIKRMRLQHLNREVGQVAEMMDDMAALVDHQGKQLDAMEANLDDTKSKTLAGEQQLRQAAHAQPVRKGPAIVLGVLGAAAGTFFAGPVGLVVGPKIALGVTALMGGGMAASGGYAVTKAIQKRGIDAAPEPDTRVGNGNGNGSKASPTLPSPATPPVTSAPMAAAVTSAPVAVTVPTSSPNTVVDPSTTAATSSSSSSWWPTMPWRRGAAATTPAANTTTDSTTSPDNIDSDSDSSSEDENEINPPVVETRGVGPTLRSSTTETHSTSGIAGQLSPTTGMRRASVGRDRRPSRRSRRNRDQNEASSTANDARHKAFPGWNQ
jgi:hypothetical protein